MRDLASTVEAKTVFGPVAMNADNTPAALHFDGFRSKAFLIGVGVGGITFSGTNKIEFKLTHCDTSDGTYTAVEAKDVQITNEDGSEGAVAAGGIVLALIAEHATAGVTKVGYIGGKRYQKLLADFSGTHGTATPVCVMEVNGHPLYGPV